AFQQHLSDAPSDDDRDRDCQSAVMIIATLKSIQHSIDNENKKRAKPKIPDIKLFYYSKGAYCGVICTDTLVRYWPYLHGTVVTDSPGFDYPLSSRYAPYYRKHFDSVATEAVSLDQAEVIAKEWAANWKTKVQQP